MTPNNPGIGQSRALFKVEDEICDTYTIVDMS